MRAASMQCHVCGLRGATVQCFKTDCLKSFHLHCAARIGGKFLKDKVGTCTGNYPFLLTYSVSFVDEIYNKILCEMYLFRRLLLLP